MTTVVIPITKSGEWRTVIDVIAVGSYLIGGLPLIWIALQEFGFVNRSMDQMGRLKIHAICVALFLVFGHIAMIAGMLDPSLLGYQETVNHQMVFDESKLIELDSDVLFEEELLQIKDEDITMDVMRMIMEML